MLFDELDATEIVLKKFFWLWVGPLHKYCYIYTNTFVLSHINADLIIISKMWKATTTSDEYS